MKNRPGGAIVVPRDTRDCFFSRRSWKSQSGYSLFEMFVVASLVVIGSIIAIPVTMRMVNDARGDSAMVMTATFLETVRNRAISERRNMELSFPTDNSIRAERIEVPSGDRTVVAEMTLENLEEFAREGLPDTGDAFGGTGAINFTNPGPVMFTSDGSLLDAAGDVTNATLFIVRPGNLETARAITIWGVTGLMRTWKWRGSEWQQ